MMKWILLFTLLACTASLQAQTLQKCSSRGGVTAYRSGSCLQTETLVAVRDGGPDVRTPEQLHAFRDNPAQRQTVDLEKRLSRRPYIDRHASRRMSASRQGRKASGQDSCTVTKQARDDYERRRSIKITLAELSRWNSRVYDACKP